MFMMRIPDSDRSNSGSGISRIIGFTGSFFSPGKNTPLLSLMQSCSYLQSNMVFVKKLSPYQYNLYTSAINAFLFTIFLPFTFLFKTLGSRNFRFIKFDNKYAAIKETL